MRSFAKWVLVAVLVAAVSLAALYAALPSIVAKLAPQLAGRYGVLTFELQIAHPHWRWVQIHSVTLATDRVRIAGTGGRAEFSIEELLSGRLTRLAFDALDISVSSTDTATSPDEAPTIDPLFFTPPVGHLSVAALRVEFADTGFIGIGSADLGDGVLSFSMDGLAPEAASRLSLSATLTSAGEFSARFAELGGTGMEYLRAQGTVAETTVDIDAILNLEGFALQLVSEIAGLEPGEGSVAADIKTILPWPLPDAGSWPTVSVNIPAFFLDWKSSDGVVQLESVKGSLTVSGRDLTGALSGSIYLREAARNLSVTIPENYAFTFIDGVLTGPAGLRLRAKDADSDIGATLHSFTFASSQIPRLDVDADVAVTTRADASTIAIDGRVKGGFVRESEQPLRLDGRVDFKGRIDAYEQRRNGSVSARIVLDGDDLAVDGKVSSGIFDSVPFSLDYRLETGAGAFAADKLMVFDKAFAASVMPGWDKPYDLDAGRIDASLNLNWETMDEVAAHLVLSLDKGRAHYEEDTASGIAALLRLHASDASDVATWRLEPTLVNARRIDIGLPIDDLRMSVSWAGDAVQVSDLQASLLGGRLYAGEFTYGIESGEAGFPVRLEDIDLAQVLALEGDDIVGTGKLDGILPVVVTDDQPSVAAGTIAAQPPGGTIRLTSSFAGPTGQPGLDFALVALKDFRYSDLRAEVDYAANGDLTLAVHLKGRNPAVEKGRAILYNLNITENVPQLLESLQLEKKLSERIEKGVKK